MCNDDVRPQERRGALGVADAEELPSHPPASRRRPGAGWRLAFRTRAGIARGFLRFWPVWERITLFFRPIMPIPGAIGGAFLVRVKRYRGRPIILPDGTAVNAGDRVCELHMNNHQVAHFTDMWQIMHAMITDLRALADWSDQPEFPQEVRALFGFTLLSRGAPRLGFTVRQRPATLHTRLERFFMMGLLALYNPHGVARLRRGTTFARYPQEVWMSLAELRRRYGDQAPSRRSPSQAGD